MSESSVVVTVSAESSIITISSLPILTNSDFKSFQSGLLPIRLGIITALVSSVTTFIMSETSGT